MRLTLRFVQITGLTPSVSKMARVARIELPGFSGLRQRSQHQAFIAGHRDYEWYIG
jgi:hypothetical protein